MIKFPAEYVVFWPGQEVLVCKRHIDQLNELNRVMGGAQLSFRCLSNIDEEGECVNCISEEKS